MNIGLSILAILCLVAIPLSTNVWLDSGLILIAFVSVGVNILRHRMGLLPYLMILSAIPIVPFVKWFEPAFEKQATEVIIRNINSELDIAEASISQFFQGNASALESIVVLVSQSEAVSDEQYQSWLEQILPPQRNQFLNIALSKELIVKNVYPPSDANLKVLGVDLGNVSGQGLLYRNAENTQEEVVIGPVQLLQGVPGVIYVRPIKDPRGLIISGVLSLQYLKDDLEILLANGIELDVLVSSLAVDFQLKSFNKAAQSSFKIERVLHYGDIKVRIAATSTRVDNIIRKTRYLTRISSVAFWLCLSLILGWQQMNYRIRERQRLTIEKSEMELIAAQRLGQMGSWISDDKTHLGLSVSLTELIDSKASRISFETFFDLMEPGEKQSISKQIEQFIQSDLHSFMVEHQLRKGNQYQWFEHRIARNPDGHLTGILRNIHSLRQKDEQVALLESFDSLTGAANRHYFKQLTMQNIALCERRRSTIALALVNIDDFRTINEKHGQLTGDELLKQMAHRLQTSSRKSDSIARLSGDTFAIALVDIGENKQSVLVIEQILRRLKEPYPLAEDIYPQFTMGVAMYPVDGQDYDTLLQMAESALNNAKSESRGHYRFYSAELSEQTDRRQRILAALPGAIRNDYLSLVFQPRVPSTKKARATSMEALVRWNDPKLGFVSPGEFIPIAEQTTLIGDIGKWVMEHVFQLMARYKDKLPSDLTVSINLSPRQLEDPSLVKNVRDLLSKYQVKARQFELEITEYSISGKSDSIMQNMHELSAMGFQFAMDDFGTGYSNLGVLQSLPLNVLKVDMSFIRAIGSNQKSDELVKAILNMGHTLGLKVVAEGVESAEQVQFLRDLNCDELQGYYFFRPSAIEDLLSVLTDGK